MAQGNSARALGSERTVLRTLSTLKKSPRTRTPSTRWPRERFAFVRKNTRLGSFITGGMQEKGFRAGTESVHNIYGMSEALKISLKNLEFLLGKKKG